MLQVLNGLVNFDKFIILLYVLLSDSIAFKLLLLFILVNVLVLLVSPGSERLAPHDHLLSACGHQFLSLVSHLEEDFLFVVDPGTVYILPRPLKRVLCLQRERELLVRNLGLLQLRVLGRDQRPTQVLLLLRLAGLA